MKKLTILFAITCMFIAMQAYASCESVITPSQAAAKAAASDPGSYCIEGYVVSTVDIYCKTSSYENQSFMMSDQPGGAPVFEAWRVVGVDHTLAPGSYVRIVDATLQMYGDVAETKAGFTVQIISEVVPDLNLPEYGALLTAAQAEAICLSLPYHDTPTEEVYVVHGFANDVVTIDAANGIQSVYIADEKGTGYYFQAWECQNIKNINGDYMPIEVGDEVYITGHLSRYNKNAQIKGGYVSRYAAEPYLVRVSADPDKGYASISGKYEFTLAEIQDVQFTMTAVADPGYKFVMWIDPAAIDPENSEFATDLLVTKWWLDIYNEYKDLTDDEMVAQGLDIEAVHAITRTIEKLTQPTATLTPEDLEIWGTMQGYEEIHVFHFKAVFRPVNEGIESPSSLKGETERGYKLLRNGQLYLMYEGQMYDVRGAKAE